MRRSRQPWRPGAGLRDSYTGTPSTPLRLLPAAGACLHVLRSWPLQAGAALSGLYSCLQVLKQLADAAKELQEEVQGAAEATEEEGEEGEGEAAAGAAGSDADSDAGFGMFTAEAFTPGQLAVASRVHGLLAAVLGMAKAAVKLLLAERQACGECRTGLAAALPRADRAGRGGACSPLVHRIVLHAAVPGLCAHAGPRLRQASPQARSQVRPCARGELHAPLTCPCPHAACAHLLHPTARPAARC